MKNLGWSSPESGMELLCIGAHPDDLEIGCAGTVRRLIEEGRVARVRWVVLTGDAKRRDEGIAAAERLLAPIQERQVHSARFRDGFLPHQGVEVKEFFEGLKSGGSPDLIFTHYRSDLHQDHRFVSELTWNTFRDHLILEYELPKFDGDLGVPNVFVTLTEAQVLHKAAHIREEFPSQSSKHWMSDVTFVGLARLRGVECRSPSGYAEAFYARKLVIS